jgi:hypothetical protein
MTNQVRFVAIAAVISGLAGCASAGTSASSTASTTKPNPNLISTTEIETTPNLRDAFQVVQRLRPNWLTKAKMEGVSMSGTISGGASRGGIDASSVGGAVAVYLDYSKLGDLKALYDIPISSIATIQWMDAATATALLPGLSSGAIAGAIVVHSRTVH